MCNILLENMDWKDKYLKVMDSLSFEDGDIENAQQIKLRNIPKNIYKYRPVNEFSLSNLIDDTVWVNSPSEYNDPYEFHEITDMSSLLKTVSKKHYRELVDVKELNVSQDLLLKAELQEDPVNYIFENTLKSLNIYSDEEIEQILDVSKSVIEENLQKKLNEKLSYMQRTMKVSSFCESPDVLLMWSHYADSHSGICIEYNIDRWHHDDIRRRILYPVNYTSEMYDSTKHLENFITKSNFNNLYPIISGTRKSLDWKYEKEWRLIFQIGPSMQSQNYLMDCQSKVYLGYKISEDNKNRVKEICTERKLEVYESFLDSNSQRLDFKLIKL